VVKTDRFIDVNGPTQIPYPTIDIANYKDRYIQVVKTGDGKWDLYINLPAYPNKYYLVAAGMSGVRPAPMATSAAVPPGQIVLTRTPDSRSSRSSPAARPTCANFVAA